MLLTAASPASAQSNAQTASRAVVVSPISLVKVQDLSFGDVAAGTTGGTIVVNPDTGVRTVTGGVVALGGSVTAARFVGAGSAQTNIAIIREPKGSVLLTRAGGTETMMLNNFTLSGGNGASRKLDAAGTITFQVGGTLNVAANQMDGVYSGTFDVGIDYH